MTDFPHQIQALRPQLLRFARRQLRNDVWAEDAVSETLLAALDGARSFAGHAQLKTWLIGILKHKLIDQLRRHSREATLLTEEDELDLESILFDRRGVWVSKPSDWGDPEAAFAQRRFFEVLEACIDHLPPAQARVFMMREWLELDSDEICKALAVTPTNLWVLLHRARLRLRECLSSNWFGELAEIS